MSERLMGVETEYAFVAFAKDGSRADAREAMTQIERLAEKNLPHLPAKGQRGIFLQNASRFYRDHSNGDAHQEMTTPECPNPWDVVRYITANEQILVGLTNELLQQNGPLGEALYFKHNVDYSGSGASWGTHESYLTRSAIRSLPEHLMPHLASRVVFTGAGGFDPHSPGLKFMLSPRAAHLSQPVSLGTEHERPLFNLRDEPLCDGGFRRLHVICGESLCSHTSMWLRSATTSIVVALADAGLQPGKAVTLADPVGAMHAFAKDPTCRVRVALAAGGMVSAVAIQRHYLQLAEANVGADFMPPWTPQVCQHWRAILDRLEAGAPDSVATTLDWAIKYSLFTARLERGGLDEHHLGGNGHAPLPNSLRQELFEIDVRYGQLGERGIFAGLDRAGVLQHQFPGVDNFPHAMFNPPNLGRAKLRGNAIQSITRQRQRGCCDWTGVWNMTEHKFLDLAMPFATEEHWNALPVLPQPPAPNPPESLRGVSVASVERNFNLGAFEQAAREIGALESGQVLMAPSQYIHLARLKAWTQAKRGRLDGGEILNRIYNSASLDLAQTADHMFVLRFSGLTPRPETEGLMNSALNRFGGQQPDEFPASFREHWGAFLLAAGNVAEAEPILKGAVCAIHCEHPDQLRAEATLANAQRLLGKGDIARAMLQDTRRYRRDLSFTGHLADFTLPNLAKLVCDLDRMAAHAMIAEAKVMQSRSRNWLGLVRSLLLDARLAARGDGLPHSNEAVLTLAAELPALATCKLFEHILANWELWTRDPAVARNGDVFWGL